MAQSSHSPQPVSEQTDKSGPPSAIISNYPTPHATLCGNVRVGKGAWIAAGATVIPGISIGEWSTVAAGATVIRDVPPHTTVAGLPAKPLKKSQN